MNGITVILELLGRRTETATVEFATGFFEFTNVPPGEYTVRAEPACNLDGCRDPRSVSVSSFDVGASLCTTLRRDTVHLSVADVVGAPGENVTVDVTLAAHRAVPARVTATITFDAEAPIMLMGDNSPACEVVAAEVDVAAFTWAPSGCTGSSWCLGVLVSREIFPGPPKAIVPRPELVRHICGHLRMNLLRFDVNARPLTAAAIAPHLQTRWLGRELHCFAELDSTNTTARELAAAGAADGTVVIADAQRRGRGRLGRAWASPPGTNLYLSVRAALRRCRWSGSSQISLLAGVAACETVREWCAAEIKWPNDVLVGGRKVAGILAEMDGAGPQRVVILGIGVNLNADARGFPRRAARQGRARCAWRAARRSTAPASPAACSAISKSATSSGAATASRRSRRHGASWRR